MSTPAAARQQQKQRTRAGLLAAARHLFQTQGYAAATTRQIAEAAGVGVGTLFAHFADKHGVLRELLRQDTSQALALAHSELADSTHWLDAAVHHARHLYAYHYGQRDLSQVWLKEVIFDAAYYAEQFCALTGSLVRRMKRDLPAYPETELNKFAQMVLAQYFLILIKGLGNAGSTLDDWLEEFTAACRTLAVLLQRKTS